MTEHDSTTTLDTQARKNMTTMGKFDTSDLMMVIGCATNITFQSPNLELRSSNMQPNILHKDNRKN